MRKIWNGHEIMAQLGLTDEELDIVPIDIVVQVYLYKNKIDQHINTL